MSDAKFGKDDGLEIDIDTLIRENAQAVADYELTENPASDNQDLQDRQALRRVSGLSTELQDVSDAEYRQLRLEKVVLVGVWIEGSAKDADNSIKELAALAQTAGSQFEGRVKEHTTVANLPAIIPTVTGRAWIMGEATWVLDPADPFPSGFTA